MRYFKEKIVYLFTYIGSAGIIANDSEEVFHMKLVINDVTFSNFNICESLLDFFFFLIFPYAFFRCWIFTFYLWILSDIW